MKKKGNKTEPKKHKRHLEKMKSTSATVSRTILELTYRFLVLLGILILAGIAITLKIDLPVVWTFLYGIGGWAALTTNSGNPLR